MTKEEKKIEYKKSDERGEQMNENIDTPKISEVKIMPKMNFAEYKLNINEDLAAALRSYANVKNDMEEKTKEEWDKLLKSMQNRRTKMQ